MSTASVFRTLTQTVQKRKVAAIFETQQLLQSTAGRDIRLIEFNPIKRENLNLLSYYCRHCEG